MPEFELRCAAADRDKLDFLLHPEEELAGRHYIYAEWNEHAQAFREISGEFDSTIDYEDELNEMVSLPGCPPFYAISRSRLSFALIFLGGEIWNFDVTSIGYPTIVFYDENEYVYDKIAKSLLYFELKKEFDLYVEMRG